jgi:hypothetical protein
MLTPYNSRFSSNSFSTGSQGNPYPLPSSTSTASAFDIGSTGSPAPVFQSGINGLPTSYPSSATSAFDTSSIPSSNEGLQQIVSLLYQIVTQLIKQVQANSGSGTNSPNFDQSGTTGGADSGSPGPSPVPSSSDPPSTDSPSPSTGSSGSNPPDQSSGTGWNKNVAVMASSDAQHETVDSYSGGKLVGGYLSDLENNMDSDNNIAQANADAEAKNDAGAESSGVTANSLVKGKGGNAVIVTGDGYDGPDTDDADQLADKLKKDYGMNVTVIKDASPNQLKAALQQMGQQKGQQCMVAVLAHGAKDDSGQNNGMMALGKGDGDQWLSEADLKSEVNQYLSPNYGNVNVLLNSCFSGNFVN